MGNIFWRALGTSQKYSEKSCNMFKPFFPDIAPLSFYSSRSLARTPADKTCRGPWSPSLPSLTTHWQMSPPVPHGLWYQISQFQILSDIKPEPKYLMVADFMRYFIRIKISHGCRFHKILHQNQNNLCLQISWDILPEWLQMSWDITPELLHLMTADFMRYYTGINLSDGCRYQEILHQTPFCCKV